MEIVGVLVISVLCFAGAVSITGSESLDSPCSTTFKGCSIDKGVCVCEETIDCTNPYPYKDLHECKKDMKGELDKCRREPCTNGQCVQVKLDQSRRWECFCAGSGFYGKKCEKKCPPFDREKLPYDYPSDCVY